jgi:hypothetical protein
MYFNLMSVCFMVRTKFFVGQLFSRKQNSNLDNNFYYRGGILNSVEILSSFSNIEVLRLKICVCSYVERCNEYRVRRSCSQYSVIINLLRRNKYIRKWYYKEGRAQCGGLHVFQSIN